MDRMNVKECISFPICARTFCRETLLLDIGYDMVWPMSIMMKCFTSQDDDEIRWCMRTLLKTDAGMGFIHESFNKDDATNFTRPWFAWQNTLFGELVLKLIADGKAPLLNNL